MNPNVGSLKKSTNFQLYGLRKKDSNWYNHKWKWELDQDHGDEDPEITFSHRHTKITIIYEAAIDKKKKKRKEKKNQNLAEKIFYKKSYKDKTTIRWVWGLESWYSSQDPYPLVSDLQTGGSLQLERFSLQSNGSEPHTGLPILEPCIGKMSHQNVWLWRPMNRAYFCEVQRVVGNRAPLLKGTYKILHAPNSGTK